MRTELADRLVRFLAEEGHRFRTRKFRAAFRDLPVAGRVELSRLACAGLFALEPVGRLLRRLRVRAGRTERAAASLVAGCRTLALPLDEAAVRAACAARSAALAPALLDELSGTLRATPSAAALHPEWIGRFLERRFGAAGAARCMAFHNGPADQHLLLRAGSDEADALEEIERILSVVPERIAGGLHRIAVPPSAFDLEALACVRRGDACPTSVPAAAIAEFAGARARALDLCAAPGGKSATLLLAGFSGTLVAGDRLAAKARALRDNLARFLPDPFAVAHDGCRPPYRAGAFDLVLVDAPCSGSGLLRRRPELRGRLKPEDLTRNRALQRALLFSAAPLVAPGGMLVYSTCSIDPRENEAQVEGFLARHGDFRPSAAAGGPVAARCGFASTQTVEPLAHGLDGFFFACLERESGL